MPRTISSGERSPSGERNCRVPRRVSRDVACRVAGGAAARTGSAVQAIEQIASENTPPSITMVRRDGTPSSSNGEVPNSPGKAAVVDHGHIPGRYALSRRVRRPGTTLCDKWNRPRRLRRRRRAGIALSLNRRSRAPSEWGTLRAPKRRTVRSAAPPSPSRGLGDPVGEWLLRRRVPKITLHRFALASHRRGAQESNCWFDSRRGNPRELAKHALAGMRAEGSALGIL